ncbi:hypothetical protein ACHAWU_006028 [Discostella pseudostelligera]|uniref:Uncharacterized protein n=1 Tax=Discostella pseudostelligera TaxID=259834 RepID=A0ABD3M1P6_9STRA
MLSIQSSPRQPLASFTMASATRSTLFLLIVIAWHITLPCPTDAYVPSQSVHRSRIINRIHHDVAPVMRVKSLTNDNDYGKNDSDDVELEIFRGSESEISDETWRDIEGAAPSPWTIMKELLGINIFTYILAAAIVFFLSMNAIAGPGWLGQTLGWEDVGTFTRVSDSLPLSVDVSGSQYLL